MNRWLALLIAVVGGGILATVFLIPIVGAVAGVLWFFVFGDDPWPTWVDPVAGVLLLVVCVGLWAAASRAIWTRLRRHRAG